MPNRGSTTDQDAVAAHPEEIVMRSQDFPVQPRAARRRWLARSLVIAALAGTPLLMASSPLHAQSPEKKKVTIAVGGKSALYYLPLTIAEELGYFKDEGLDVEIVDFAGGSKSLQAVVGGSADVVSGAYEHTINLQSRKQYFTEFVLMGRAPQISVGIHKSKVASYKSPKDLKGMKIGVSAPGSSTNMVANYVLAQGGSRRRMRPSSGWEPARARWPHCAPANSTRCPTPTRS